MEILRFCGGILSEDGVEDFYWDTQFSSYEECEEWCVNRGLTHIYDNIEDRFYRIGCSNICLGCKFEKECKKRMRF